MPNTDEIAHRLQRFWDSRDVDVACPICRKKEFGLDVGGEIHVPMALDVSLDERPQLYLRQATYIIHCSNCGFVVNFMKSVVDGSDDAVNQVQASKEAKIL